MKDWGESVSELMIVKKKTITRNCTQYCLTWVFLPFVHVVKFLICLVCIVVVDLSVLLSYVYLLYYVCIAVFYFRCHTAG